MRLLMVPLAIGLANANGYVAGTAGPNWFWLLTLVASGLAGGWVMVEIEMGRK